MQRSSVLPGSMDTFTYTKTQGPLAGANMTVGKLNQSIGGSQEDAISYNLTQSNLDYTLSQYSSNPGS